MKGYVMDFATMSNEEITAELATKKEAAKALFALTEPTIEQVDEAEALVASIGEIEAEQATREAAVKDASDRFAAARATFAADDEAEVVTEVEAEVEEEAEEANAETEDAASEPAADEATGEESADDGDVEEGGEAVTTASAVNHTKSQTVKVSAAQRVASKTKRPAVKKASPVVITAAADVPGFATGSVIDDMEQVTKALMNRAKGFAPFNKSAAMAVAKNSGGMPVLNKFGVASFGIDMDPSLIATRGNDYAVVKAALAQDRFGGDTLTAGGWCAPSENVYSFIADYVVDGLITVPEVGITRGGINITTGPARSSQGTALDDFGFVQTEAQAEAGTVKTCETIVCPDFVDHRLDAIGYCYKIPFLTQKAYPELITDALRFANVLYAHKINARIIADLVALSGAVESAPLGASFNDTLEALSIIAVKKRRRFSVGRRAIMEVKLPEIAQEVFRADMSRRAGRQLSDVASDNLIAAEFSARRLAVEYVADWQEDETDDALFPASFDAMIYPAGTFVKGIEDVVNLSAVYDAASLSINEYTGVFFEQGILTAQVGYDSDLVTIPVCTAGNMGAADLTCVGGSF